MSYRRAILAAFAGLLGYLLWFIVKSDSAVAMGAVWPVITGIVIILMLPEERLQGDLLVKLVEALKGSKLRGD